MMLKRTGGFTLIELVVTVAIVAILATIALPSYMDSVRKSRRRDAEAALLNMQMQEEKFRANNSSYTSVTSTVGAPASGSSTLTYYTFTVPTATATTFTVQAAAISGKSQTADKQSGQSCATLSIDQSGVKLPAACW